VNVITTMDSLIEAWIKQCLSLAEAIDCDQVVKELSELDVRWQFPGFRLAFVGEFSRGKSTLINRLLEREVVPVGSKPTTGHLVSIVAGATEKIEIFSPDEGWIVRAEEPSSWTEFLASEQSQEHEGSITQVRLTLDHPWLRSTDVEFIDSPGAGDLNSDRTTLICNLLSQCDAAIILVSATLPLSATESTFLEQEVLGRHVPNVLVAISKLDMLPQEEKGELLDVIHQRVMRIATSIPILPLHPLDEDISDVNALTSVRTQIEAMVKKSERKKWRCRRVAGQLFDYLDHIEKLCEIAIESGKMSGNEQKKALRELEQQQEKAEIHWEDIRLTIDQRRLQHMQKLRQNIMQAKNDLVDIYSHELKGEKDLKNWWENDLPYKLRRELTARGNIWSQEILAGLSLDFKWALTEVDLRFSRQIAQNKATLSSPVLTDVQLSPLQLSDNLRNHSLVTGLARTSTAICSMIAGGPSSTELKALAIVAGVVVTGGAWVFSELLNDKHTGEQRQFLLHELNLNLDQIADTCYDRLSERIRELYNQLIDELQHEQIMWQYSWELTLNNCMTRQNTSCYLNALEQVTILKKEIAMALSHSHLKEESFP